MSPALIPGLGIWLGSIIAGYRVGKQKGRVGAGLALTILFGLIGLIILACLPRTKAVKAAEAQRQYEIQAAAAGNAGYSYPPQQAYAPYPQPGQGSYPQQPYAPYPPPGQYPQQPYAPYLAQGQGPYPPPPGQRQQPPWEQQQPAT